MHANYYQAQQNLPSDFNFHVSSLLNIASYVPEFERQLPFWPRNTTPLSCVFLHIDTSLMFNICTHYAIEEVPGSNPDQDRLCRLLSWLPSMFLGNLRKVMYRPLPHSFQAGASFPCYAGTVQHEAMWLEPCNSQRTALYGSVSNWIHRCHVSLIHSQLKQTKQMLVTFCFLFFSVLKIRFKLLICNDIGLQWCFTTISMANY